MKEKTKLIAETAVMMALLIVLQALTKGFGQFVTGSCVNCILALTTLLCGLPGALTVAVLSPFFAFLFGIGPAFLPIVPGIAAGNAVLVLVLWFMLGKSGAAAGLTKKTATVAAAAVAKFAALYLLVVVIILPLLQLNEKQAAVIGASFSWPQLVTAAIGTALAIVIAARLRHLRKQ